MKDNIGNQIHIGDCVFCYSGSKKNTIQKVTGFRYSDGNSLNGVTEAVNLSGGCWLNHVNVVSLNALGVDIAAIEKKKRENLKCDAVGNALHIGDRVLYLHSKEMYAEVGVVKSIALTSCLLSIRKNRFGQEEYRKKTIELISLDALGINDDMIRTF